jgi:hypothetical protein
VTDSKAVTGSKSGFDFGGSAGSIVVIVTGVAAGIVFTVLLVCLFVTCRRKVSGSAQSGYWGQPYKTFYQF